jgi:hypothetical protein
VLRLFAPVSWRGTTPVTVSLSIGQGARVIVRKTDQLIATSAESAPGQRFQVPQNSRAHASFSVSLPMTGVPPGDYILSVVVSGSGRPARRDVAFTVRR